ncbi:MAG: GntR family transcriptional regulator [Eubacteriales bacterium]|nr:GntR family transcriptional regulator [Eubacteriales bacterium]
MKWNIDESLPIWPQLYSRLSAGIAARRFPPGSRLPSVRELAADAGVNPNTMQRALTELEMKGLIVTNRTAGRNVCMDQMIINAVRQEEAERKIGNMLKSMEELGYRDEEIRRMIEDVLQDRRGEEG